MTNKGKKPTTTDKAILAFLETGNCIDHVRAIKLFRTTGLRDSVYRLRQDGNVIQSRDIYYEKNSTKHYRQYFITEPVFLPAGCRTEKEKNFAKKSKIKKVATANY